MKSKIVFALAALLFAAACSQPTPAASGPIAGAGVVQAVDPQTGSITLKHEPIEAIHWGAMTMEFKAADPSILQGVAVGDRVAFELKSAAEPQTVTMVQKQ